jgi:hypothetical protein
VLDPFVRRQPRGCGAWRHECAFGRYRRAFVQRFGVDVAMVKPLLQALNSIGVRLFFFGCFSSASTFSTLTLFPPSSFFIFNDH